MRKTHRNRVVTVLGAGGVLAAVLSATGPAALAQPAAAQAPSLPKACVAVEALVGDGASGSGIGAGEVLRVSPGGQSTLTTNTAPMGTPNLDDPTDMAFLPNGDIVVTDESFTAGRPDVVEVNPSTGARTLISGTGRGSGPALVMPATVAVEASGYIMVTDIAAGTGNQRVLQIDPATAWDVQGELTSKSQHRSAGPVDLVVAATAELHGLTLLHHDRDFGVIARVTGQPVRWYGPD